MSEKLKRKNATTCSGGITATCRHIDNTGRIVGHGSKSRRFYHYFVFMQMGAGNISANLHQMARNIGVQISLIIDHIATDWEAHGNNQIAGGICGIRYFEIGNFSTTKCIAISGIQGTGADPLV